MRCITDSLGPHAGIAAPETIIEVTMPNGPTTLALPAFSGATRRLILIHVVIFFVDAILGLVLPAPIYTAIASHLVLLPVSVVHGQIWQLLTFTFMPLSLFNMVFVMLWLWWLGSMLEEVRSARWLVELYLTSAVAGAILAIAICYTHLFHLEPMRAIGIGPETAIFGLTIAAARLLGDTEILLLFILRIKIKYMVAIYILIDVALLLKTNNAFEALLQLSGAAVAFAFLRLIPRRGLAHAATERYFNTRNEIYKSKRRRAAKKFEVYMSKQGREVRFDKDGRYLDPDQDKDPNDKRWMN